ncbi:hypothetical protein DRN32_06970, partial [Thermococci archaeon]
MLLFLKEIDRVARILKSMLKEKSVKIISHYDADGLTSSAILIKALLREGASFQLKVIKQLTKKEIGKIDASSQDLLLLADLGSGQLKYLKELLDRTHVLIIDHHHPYPLTHMNLFHLNPMIFNEEGVSASIISYLFAKSLDKRNANLIDLAIVGAVGDAQDERWELRGLAKKVLREAENMGKVVVTKGLRLYGRNMRPIHKALELAFDPFIPGISGSESNAVQLLAELGIPVKEGERWRKLSDLTLEEQRRLASAIIIERLKGERSNAEDIFGDIYTLPERPKELQDAREFATILNACGKFGKPDVAIRLCLGDESAISEALQIFEEYRKAINEALEWIRKNKNALISTKFGTFLLAGSSIPEDLIGTVTSILLNSNFVDKNKPLFGLAEAKDGMVKVSARAGRLEVNLREAIVEA